jgi:hypothetical protein
VDFIFSLVRIRPLHASRLHFSCYYEAVKGKRSVWNKNNFHITEHDVKSRFLLPFFVQLESAAIVFPPSSSSPSFWDECIVVGKSSRVAFVLFIILDLYFTFALLLPTPSPSLYTEKQRANYKHKEIITKAFVSFNLLPPTFHCLAINILQARDARERETQRCDCINLKAYFRHPRHSHPRDWCSKHPVSPSFYDTNMFSSMHFYVIIRFILSHDMNKFPSPRMKRAGRLSGWRANTEHDDIYLIFSFRPLLRAFRGRRRRRRNHFFNDQSFHSTLMPCFVSDLKF